MTMWSRWRERANERKAVRAAADGAHRFAVQRTRSKATHTSYKDFYKEDPLRRGDDIPLGSVADDEVEWKVTWLPRTHEVVAFATHWVDEGRHRSAWGGGSEGGGAAVGTAPVPEAICVLGHRSDATAAEEVVHAQPDFDLLRRQMAEPGEQ